MNMRNNIVIVVLRKKMSATATLTRKAATIYFHSSEMLPREHVY